VDDARDRRDPRASEVGSAGGEPVGRGAASFSVRVAAHDGDEVQPRVLGERRANGEIASTASSEPSSGTQISLNIRPAADARLASPPRPTTRTGTAGAGSPARSRFPAPAAKSRFARASSSPRGRVLRLAQDHVAGIPSRSTASPHPFPRAPRRRRQFLPRRGRHLREHRPGVGHDAGSGRARTSDHAAAGARASSTANGTPSRRAPTVVRHDHVAEGRSVHARGSEREAPSRICGRVREGVGDGSGFEWGVDGDVTVWPRRTGGPRLCA